jgi:hypothetical protein
LWKSHLERAAKNVAPWTSSYCPSNDSIECPAGNGCEDNPPSCFSSLELEGFGLDYDGRYASHSHLFSTEFYESSKPLYTLKSEYSETMDKCLWWHRRLRNWVLGECQNVGTSKSFAYINADVPCPHPEEQRWVNSKTGMYLKGIKNYSEERPMTILNLSRTGNQADVELHHDKGAAFGQPLEITSTSGTFMK